MTPRPSHERGYISKHVLGELALSVMQGMSFVVTPVTSAGRADRVSFFPPPRGREMMYIWRSAGDENNPRERKAVGGCLDLGNFEVIIGQMLTQQNPVSNVTKIVKRKFQGELGRNHMKL